MFGRDDRVDANVRWSISARSGGSGSSPLYIYEGPYNTGGSWDARLAIFPGGNVGIGSTNPTTRLQVNGSFTIYSNVSGDNQGYEIRFSNPLSGGTNRRICAWKMENRPNGARLLLLGRNDDNSVRNVLMGITLENDYVGIGKDNPSEKLDVNGHVKGTSFINSSSIANKTDLKLLSGHSAYKVIKSLKIYEYERLEEDVKGYKQIGVIADEAPDEILNTDKTGVDLYSYISLIAKAVQDIQKKLEALEQQIGG